MRRIPSPPAPKTRYKGAYKVVSIIQIECIGKPGKPERAGKKESRKKRSHANAVTSNAPVQYVYLDTINN